MKKILLVVVLVFSIAGAYAQHLTEQQAMERALQYLNDKSTSSTTHKAAPARNRKTTLESAQVEASGIYAFNIEDGGFIIASADSRTLPVLGYSTSGSIDWDNMPDNMRSWLKSYQDAIATLGDRTDFIDGNYLKNRTNSPSDSRQDWAPVEPLIKTHWDQDEPYWNQVPQYDGDRTDLKGKQCYTGCVATAMAQVMNYYQWPKSLPDGMPSYDIIGNSNGDTLIWHIDALPPVVFDWNNMINDYKKYNDQTNCYEQLGTEEQNKAVATLMRYCGQSVGMCYGTYELGGSGADTEFLDSVFTDIFDYKAAQIVFRESVHSIYEWEKIIYTELAEGRPVVYGGYCDDGGHEFVCDGYDGNGMFHINWGWSGYDDGYFNLSVLNPYNNTSSGSGSSGIGYCIYQDAVIYTDPNMDPQPHHLSKISQDIYSNLSISIEDGGTVWFMYEYYAENDTITDNALGTIGPDGELTPVYLVDYTDSILFSYHNYDYNYFYVKIDSTEFQAGQYLELYPMVRLRQPGQPWQLIQPIKEYILTGCDENGEFYCVTKFRHYDLTCTGVSITAGTGRLDERNDVTIFVSNNDTIDFIGVVFVYPYYYGHVDSADIDQSPIIVNGDRMVCEAYIPAKSQGEVTFSFVPECGGTVVFKFKESRQVFGYVTLELNNDTLNNYDQYLKNNSWFSKEGNEWFYNIELYDLPDVYMPYWIPSDSIGIKARLLINGEEISHVLIRDEIRDYLKDLPEKGGDGNYFFRYKIPIDMSQYGEYYMDSYIGEWINGTLTDYSCSSFYKFTKTDPTIIETVSDANADDTYYNLQGLPINGIPKQKGIYIKGNKKVLIR